MKPRASDSRTVTEKKHVVITHTAKKRILHGANPLMRGLPFAHSGSSPSLMQLREGLSRLSLPLDEYPELVFPILGLLRRGHATWGLRAEVCLPLFLMQQGKQFVPHTSPILPTTTVPPEQPAHSRIRPSPRHNLPVIAPLPIHSAPPPPSP